MSAIESVREDAPDVRLGLAPHSLGWVITHGRGVLGYIAGRAEALDMLNALAADIRASGRSVEIDGLDAVEPTQASAPYARPVVAKARARA